MATLPNVSVRTAKKKAGRFMLQFTIAALLIGTLRVNEEVDRVSVGGGDDMRGGIVAAALGRSF